MWFDSSFKLIIKCYNDLKGNLVSILIKQIARLYTEDIQSYGCLNDEV